MRGGSPSSSCGGDRVSDPRPGRPLRRARRPGGHEGRSLYPLVGAAVGALAGASSTCSRARYRDGGGHDRGRAGRPAHRRMRLDALADTADALAGRTRERRLEIMRDHRSAHSGPSHWSWSCCWRSHCSRSSAPATSRSSRSPPPARSRWSPLPIALALPSARDDGQGRSLATGISLAAVLVGSPRSGDRRDRARRGRGRRARGGGRRRAPPRPLLPALARRRHGRCARRRYGALRRPRAWSPRTRWLDEGVFLRTGTATALSSGASAGRNSRVNDTGGEKLMRTLLWRSPPCWYLRRRRRSRSRSPTASVSRPSTCR